MSGGRKDDSKKIRMDLLPSPALYEVARVLTHGCAKYDDWNWAKGMDWSRVIGALERHLEKFKYKIDIDEESGLLHIAQVACNALFLLTYQIMNLGNDDRWNPSAESLKYMEEMRQWITQTEEQIKEKIPVELSLDNFKKTESIELDIKETQKEILYQIAKKENKTVNQVIREAIEEILDETEEESITSSYSHLDENL